MAMMPSTDLKRAIHYDDDEFPQRSVPQILAGIARLFGNMLFHPLSMPWRYVLPFLRLHLLELWWALTYPDE